MDWNTFEKSLTGIKEHLISEFTLIRTGRASLSLLDNVRAEVYGSLMPLNQVGSMSVEDARTIKIAPWDASVVGAIEKGVMKSDLGVTTSVSEGGVRVHFPELTGETRERIAKVAKEKHEEARIAVKNERNKVMSQIEQEKKDGMSEDEVASLKAKVEAKVSEMNKEFDELLEKKRTEILG